SRRADREKARSKRWFVSLHRPVLHPLHGRHAWQRRGQFGDQSYRLALRARAMIGAAKMGISKTVQSAFAPIVCARPAAARVPARGMKELEPRVFLVDDDQSVRKTLAELLTREDYAVETFASAAEYLARVPHVGPACIVLEVQ